MDKGEELQMRLKLLRKLWDSIVNLDEFTEQEKQSIQMELQICEEQCDRFAEVAKFDADLGLIRKQAETRERVLNDVFSSSQADCSDVMKIFVDEQTRLRRAT